MGMRCILRGVAVVSRSRRLYAHTCKNPVTTRAATPDVRVLNTSNGLSTPQLRAVFYDVLKVLRMQESTGGTRDPTIAYISTAVLAPSGVPSKKTPGEKRRLDRQESERRAKSLALELELPVKAVDVAVTQGSELEAALLGAAAVYVEGGNTFWLAYHAQQSGFYALAKHLVTERGVLYVGRSAGSIVAGTTISTALWKGWDDPSIVPLDITDAADMAGMGLVQCSFFPHFAPKWEALVTERSSSLDHACATLRDGAGELWVGGARAAVIDPPVAGSDGL